MESGVHPSSRQVGTDASRSVASAPYGFPERPSRFSVEGFLRLVLGLGMLAVIGWLVWYFSALLIYLVIGLVIAYLFRPFVDYWQGFGMGRVPAIFTTFALVVGGIAILLTYLSPFAASQIGDLWAQVKVESAVQVAGFLEGTLEEDSPLSTGDYIVSVDQVMIQETRQLQELMSARIPGDEVVLVIRNAAGDTRTVRWMVPVSEDVSQAPAPGRRVSTGGKAVNALGIRVRTVRFFEIIQAIESRLNEVLPLQQGVISNAIGGVLEALFKEDRLSLVMGSIFGFFANVFYAVIIIPFVIFFMLKDGAQIKKSLFKLVPNRYFEITLSLHEQIEAIVGRYFVGLLIQCISIGVLASLLLTLAGLESSVAVGIFAGVSNTIPYFGPLMGFLAGTLVGITQTGDFSLVLPILLAMGITQLADNILFQPLIFSRVARAHPLVILFVVLIGAQLAGIFGMLVAIPVMTIVWVTIQQVIWSFRSYRIVRMP